MADFGTPTTATVLDDQSFLDNAMSMGFGSVEAGFQSLKDSFLDTPVAGTLIRGTAIPSGAPVAPDAIQSVGGFEPTPTPPIQLEDQAAFEARRAAAQPMTKEAYEASPYFRPAIPWDARMNAPRAAALADWYDARQHRERMLSYSNTFAVQTISGFIGAALDPSNYIPMLGPSARAWAIGRAGVIAGHALAASADAAIGTALSEVATAPMRREFGDDVSFGSILLDVGGAAVIGAAFGGLGGALFKRQIDRGNFAIRRVQEVQRSLEDAVSSLAIDGEVRITPATMDVLDRVRTEELAAARGRTDANLRSSTALSRFLPDDHSPALPPTLEEFLQQRATAAAREERPAVFASLDRTTEQLEAIDARLRDLREPEREGTPAGETIAAPPSGAPDPASVPPSRPRTDETAGLEAGRARLQQERQSHADAAAEAVQRHLDAQSQGPRSLFVPPRPVDPALPAAAARVERSMQPVARPAPAKSPEVDLAAAKIADWAIPDVEGTRFKANEVHRISDPRNREIAEAAGMDPDTGTFPELVDYERLIRNGQLTEADREAWKDAEMMLRRTQAYADGLRAAAICMMV